MNGLIEFIKSHEFLEGIYVEITGGIIQGIFIVICIPIGLAIYNRIRFNPTNFLVSFEVLRIFQKCLSLFVEISFNGKHQDILLGALAKDEVKSLLFHRFYGTLKDDLILMTQKADQESILNKIKAKTTEQVEEIIKELNQILEQMEKLSYMMSFHPKKQELFYKLRSLFFPLRDAFGQVKQNPSQMNLGPFGSWYTIPELMINISQEVESLSKKPMKLIDKRIKHQTRLGYLYMFFQTIKKVLRLKKER